MSADPPVYPDWYDPPGLHTTNGYPLNEYPKWNYSDSSTDLARGWWCSYYHYVLLIACDRHQQPLEFCIRAKDWSHDRLISYINSKTDYHLRGYWAVLWIQGEEKKTESDMIRIIDNLIMEMML